MKKQMEVDNFIKEKLETVEVKFNPAHWDKLQQSLQSPNFKVDAEPEVAGKVWSVGKIVAVIISTVLCIMLAVYLLKEDVVKLKQEEPSQPDTETQMLPNLQKNTEINTEPELLKSPGIDTLIVTRPTAKDSVEKKNQKQLKDSLEESNFIFW